MVLCIKLFWCSPSRSSCPIHDEKLVVFFISARICWAQRLCHWEGRQGRSDLAENAMFVRWGHVVQGPVAMQFSKPRSLGEG